MRLWAAFRGLPLRLQQLQVQAEPTAQSVLADRPVRGCVLAHPEWTARCASLIAARRGARAAGMCWWRWETEVEGTKPACGHGFAAFRRLARTPPPGQLGSLQPGLGRQSVQQRQQLQQHRAALQEPLQRRARSTAKQTAAALSGKRGGEGGDRCLAYEWLLHRLDTSESPALRARDCHQTRQHGAAAAAHRQHQVARQQSGLHEQGGQWHPPEAAPRATPVRSLAEAAVGA